MTLDTPVVVDHSTALPRNTESPKGVRFLKTPLVTLLGAFASHRGDGESVVTSEEHNRGKTVLFENLEGTVVVALDPTSASDKDH